jgi:hypothetical protein
MIGHGRWLVVLLVAAMFTLFGSGGYGLWQNRQQSENARAQLCQAANESRSVLRDVLLLARDTIPRNPRLTPRERAQAAEFYAKALAKVEPIDCQALKEGDAP